MKLNFTFEVFLLTYNFKYVLIYFKKILSAYVALSFHPAQYWDSTFPWNDYVLEYVNARMKVCTLKESQTIRGAQHVTYYLFFMNRVLNGEHLTHEC